MDLEEFPSTWQDAWNSHDLDQIMAHYAPDVVFRSRKAIPLTGAGEIRGSQSLRSYWAAALERQPDLRFTVTAVYFGHEMLTIAYDNQNGVHASETLWFGADGLVTLAAACHAT